MAWSLVGGRGNSPSNIRFSMKVFDSSIEDVSSLIEPVRILHRTQLHVWEMFVKQRFKVRVHHPIAREPVCGFWPVSGSHKRRVQLGSRGYAYWGSCEDVRR
jgi:hypothetical protein